LKRVKFGVIHKSYVRRDKRMNISEKIAELTLQTTYESLPEGIITQVKRAILDTMGVTLAGSIDPIGKQIIRFVSDIGGKTTCSVIGGGITTSVVNAAFANGTILHALDYDDSGAHTQGHPSAPIFPVVMALAEDLGSDGKSIIESYVVGVELFSRLSRAMPMLHLKGWHPTCVFGTLAATISAAKLLKLNANQIVMALGIACSFASGIVNNFGTMTKSLHIGNAARNAITAALLAKGGFTASSEVFADGGFVSIFTNQSNTEQDLLKSLESWGNPYALLSPGISVKKYPSCSLTHRAIDALIDIQEEKRIQAQDVRSIECKTTPRAVKVLSFDNPQNSLEAKFSMQFVLATAFIDYNVELKHFSEGYLQDSTLRELMKKVKISVHDDWTEQDSNLRPDVVTITLNDGTVYSREVQFSRGSALSPMSMDELIAKFKMCAGTVINDDDMLRVLDIISTLESKENIYDLMRIVSLRSNHGGK